MFVALPMFPELWALTGPDKQPWDEHSQEDFGFADFRFRRPSSGTRRPKDAAKRAWASLRHESGRITSHRFSTIPLLNDDDVRGNAYDERFRLGNEAMSPQRRTTSRLTWIRRSVLSLGFSSTTRLVCTPFADRLCALVLLPLHSVPPPHVPPLEELVRGDVPRRDVQVESQERPEHDRHDPHQEEDGAHLEVPHGQVVCDDELVCSNLLPRRGVIVHGVEQVSVQHLPAEETVNGPRPVHAHAKVNQQKEEEPPVVPLADRPPDPAAVVVEPRHVPPRGPVVLAPGDLPDPQRRADFTGIQSAVIVVVVEQRHRPGVDVSRRRVGRDVPAPHAADEDDRADLAVEVGNVRRPADHGVAELVGHSPPERFLDEGADPPRDRDHEEAAHLARGRVGYDEDVRGPREERQKDHQLHVQIHGVQHTPCRKAARMDSISPAKKRKVASCDPPPPPGQPGSPGNDDTDTDVPANFSLADLNRLIDHRVEEVEAKTLALTSRVDGLQRENGKLLLRCESLERSVQVLKREGNWTYSAPDVPRSHWIDQGHNEDYAEEAENLIQSIKDGTCDLRSAVDVEANLGCETLVLSDSVLNPHWEQLANAIQLSERISKLNFHNVQLDEHTLQMIEASVRQKGITGFHLSDNSFVGVEGVRFASDVLKATDRLRHSAGVGTIFTVQRMRVILLMPYWNTRQCIPDFLSTNPPLKTLTLEGNQFNDDDALLIAQALQSNTKLRCLDINNNALTKKGRSATYCQAILGISPSERSTLKAESESNLGTLCEANLNSVSEANHTCKIGGICKPKHFMNKLDTSAKFDRGRKLYNILRQRYHRGCIILQLESEFSGDGIGLVPHVLACVNTYSADYKPNMCLSILFELARNWKTPEIYQVH
ncbi:hypothetical protein THAOC_03064 [Thalassiosira oceanica]|uniref:Uncharacterized protein n=1 Tax=Thalassiosira oceanica TaxID=159749 RepID=K0TLE4_THAOC|nr:hypothetical protein THAOC_03064 [Thalassiosira oceanica]|eukprot:EJK75221.1 hypothetical protein THAOC_03064 [Thalassiosira oceanica]